MKKMLFLFLSLIFLFQATALAEVNKSISEHHFDIQSVYRYSIDNTEIWITLSKNGFSSNSFRNKKLQISQELHIKAYNNESATGAKTDITFSTKTPPYFVISTQESNLKQSFKISSLGTTYVHFEIDKNPLVNADRVSFVLPLKDGSTQKIDIPEDILKEWKYILSCDLWDEYKKGI